MRAQNPRGLGAHGGNALRLAPSGLLRMPRNVSRLIRVAELALHFDEGPVLDARNDFSRLIEVEVPGHNAGKPGKAGFHPIAHLPRGQPRQHAHQQQGRGLPA